MALQHYRIAADRIQPLAWLKLATFYEGAPEPIATLSNRTLRLRHYTDTAKHIKAAGRG